MIATHADESVVRLGSRVRVQDGDWEDEFTVVAPEELSTGGDCCSTDSPMGRALLGRRTGDRVRFRAPGGIMGVTVLDVRSSGAEDASGTGG